MNRGLLAKTIHEIGLATLIFGVGLGAAEGLLAYVFPWLFTTYADQILKLPLVQPIIGGFLGTGSVDSLGAEAVQSFAWVHPLVLALLWGHAIWFCTRVPAGEIDRGTIDLLLSLPASRLAVMINEAVVCAASGLVLAGLALAGNLLGTTLATGVPPGGLATRLAIAVNMYALFLAVAGMTSFVSASSDRRGRAVGTALAVVLASFLLNFLAQFWRPAHPLGVASLLDYYRPLEITRSGRWPVRDTGTLLAFAAVCWAAAVLVFRSRDLRTV